MLFQVSSQLSASLRGHLFLTRSQLQGARRVDSSAHGHAGGSVRVQDPASLRVRPGEGGENEDL